ncbi:class I SAM-dependent methyltransferase [Rhodoplanes sp. Z2-YC6860]|uniref:class I SAM-dependent methyltransferase n=1 Tax=Rhodoplanes sp. Z2-YC6860 TaxID=674703 RepID=UPI00078B9D75|nr:class I SAM-dependent methyltransferase [Rhodoplanes sp. Z2-YC6860]AMN40373.1 methyltransferase type 12 [Rhodoplanes sp. Z2-YC6860]
MSSDWVEFWDSKNPLYVDERHEAAHFRRIAEDIRSYAPEGGNGVMLDYGCGEALSASLVADKVGRLILCEPAPNVRGMLAGRYAGNPKIVVRKPDDIKIMAAESVDTIVMHSVAQYVSPQELDSLFRLFRKLLKPGGLFVLGDVIPRKVSALTDAMALLRFGSEEGFYWQALKGLVRTRFSNYWQLRKSLGLERYEEGEITAKLEAAGFTVQRARSNIGHNAKRMTFLAHAR